MLGIFLATSALGKVSKFDQPIVSQSSAEQAVGIAATSVERLSPFLKNCVVIINHGFVPVLIAQTRGSLKANLEIQAQPDLNQFCQGFT